MPVIRSLRRCLPIGSGSSEDDVPSKRTLRSSRTVSLQHPLSNTTIRKVCGRLPVGSSDESTDSEYERTIGLHASRSVRPLSDYDTGNSSGNTASALGFGILRSRSGKKLVRKLDSSTDSSDSGVPIGFQRKNKRMKLCTSSSEDSSEDVRNEEHVRIVRFDNSTRSEENHDMPDTSRNSGFSRTVRNSYEVNPEESRRVMANNSRPNCRRTGDSETESSSEEDIRPRVLSRHQIVDFDNSTSSEESNDMSNTRRNSGFPRIVRNGSERNSEGSTRMIANNSRANCRRMGDSETESSSDEDIRPRVLSRHQIVDFDNSTSSEESYDVPNTRSNSGLSRIVRNRSERNSEGSTRGMANNSRPNCRRTRDNETESSSDEDIRPRVLRHHSRTVFCSNSSSSSDSEDEVPIRRPTNQRRKARSIIYSDDDKSQQNNSDDDAEICPICLNSFNLQEVGKPTSCDHYFCLVCIKEWAKNNNTCPVDRRQFNSIAVLSSLKGTSVEVIPVFNVQRMIDGWEAEQFEVSQFPENDLEQIEIRLFQDSTLYPSDFEGVSIQDGYYSSEEEEDGSVNELCCSCQLGDREDTMICCDACLDVYHLECLNPPLRSFPVGSWICSVCENTTD